MGLDAFTAWCQQSAIAVAIRESLWLFPFIEGLHLLALALLGGTVLIVDLRLLGFGLRAQPAAGLARSVAPWMRGALAAIVVSGALLFASEAQGYVANLMFQVKMAALLVAVTFSVAVRPRVIDGPASTGTRQAMALVSVSLWTVVGITGRGIGFW